MLIGSLVELHVGLHSCLCFSHLEKLLLKVGSTPPQYLLDSQLSVELPKLFLIAISPAPRYLVDRSRLGLYPRQLLDTWWIDQASVLDSDVLFLDSSSTPQLSTSIFSTPPQKIPRYLSIPASVEIYQLLYIRPLYDSEIIFLQSLSWYFSVSLPKHSHLTPNLFLKDSSSFFKFLFTW